LPPKSQQKILRKRKLNDSILNQVSVEGKRLNRQNETIQTSLNPDLNENSDKITLATPNLEFETFESRLQDKNE
jgi:hypothetical protein